MLGGLSPPPPEINPARDATVNQPGPQFCWFFEKEYMRWQVPTFRISCNRKISLTKAYIPFLHLFVIILIFYHTILIIHHVALFFVPSPWDLLVLWYIHSDHVLFYLLMRMSMYKCKVHYERKNQVIKEIEVILLEIKIPKQTVLHEIKATHRMARAKLTRTKLTQIS